MNITQHMIALIVLLSCLLLQACASAPNLKPTVLASSQFDCLDEPSVPQDGMTDAELAVYITRLQNAGEDCRKQLAEVKHMLEVQGGVIITDVLVEKKKRSKVLGIF